MITIVTSCSGFTLPPAMPWMSKVSVPSMPSDLTSVPGLNCSGTTPMPIRLARWMRSKLFTITALTPRS
ncbi:hypothetical protein D3C83_149840 [compost metagenome]